MTNENEIFFLKIYSKRRKARIGTYRGINQPGLDSYMFEKTDSGWNFGFLTYNGPCDKTGYPEFYKSLKHDSVKYPSSVQISLSNIWNNLNNGNYNNQEIQEMFDEISNQINIQNK